MEKRGKGDMKRKKGLLSRIFAQHMRFIMITIIVIGLSATLFYKRSTYAEMSEGGKTATTILVPTGVGGLVGGVAGGAKWAGAGLGIGLVAGIGINAIRKSRAQRAERASTTAPYERQSPRSRRKGRRTKNMMNNEMISTENPSYNYVNQRNINEPY